jgi:hypothetical protein
MGNATVTSETVTGLSELAKSIQTMNENMRCMRADIDSLKRQGQPESDDQPNKRRCLSVDDNIPNTQSGYEDTTSFLSTKNTGEGAKDGDDEWNVISEFFESHSETGGDIMPELATLANKV